jgi:hypothetical protein
MSNKKTASEGMQFVSTEGDGEEQADMNILDSMRFPFPIDFRQGFVSGSAKQKLFHILESLSGGKPVPTMFVPAESFEEVICAEVVRQYEERVAAGNVVKMENYADATKNRKDDYKRKMN